jgi:hypothetical protein
MACESQGHGSSFSISEKPVAAILFSATGYYFYPMNYPTQCPNFSLPWSATYADAE